MTAYTFNWKWSLDQDCTAQPDGGAPYAIGRGQWQGFSPVRLQFTIQSSASPCDSWVSVDFQQIDGPSGASLLQRPVRVTRGQASDCNTAIFDAQCVNINTLADNGLYTFEAAVFISEQPTRRSTGQVLLRD